MGARRRPGGSGASRHRRDQSTNKSRQLAGPRPDAAAAAQLRGRNEATEPVAGRALLIGRHLLEQLGARLGIATQAIEERLPHLPQTGELLIHQSQLAVHQRIGLIEMLESHVWISLAGPGVAYLLTLFFGAYQLTDFGERESEKIAQALDALQPLDIGFRIEAVSNLGTGGRVEQADLFVIAQCSLGHPRECGHPFDADQAFCWLRVYIGLPGGRFLGCWHRGHLSPNASGKRLKRQLPVCIHLLSLDAAYDTFTRTSMLAASAHRAAAVHILILDLDTS